MRKYISFAETEQILRVTLGLPGSSIKAIAEATGIKANTLYNRDKKHRGLLYSTTIPGNGIIQRACQMW